MFGRSSNSVKGALAVQKLKTPGATAKLSFSQVVFIISNMEDAKKNLTADEYEQFKNLFQGFRSSDDLIKVDLDGYHTMCSKIIDTYEKYFPYMLVDGNVSMNLKPQDQLRIRKLYQDGFSYWEAYPKFRGNC